jgi:hypothetical protein
VSPGSLHGVDSLAHNHNGAERSERNAGKVRKDPLDGRAIPNHTDLLGQKAQQTVFRSCQIVNLITELCQSEVVSSSSIR